MRNIKSFLLIILVLLSSLVLTITISGSEYTDTGLMSLDEVSVFRNSNRYTQKENDVIVDSPYVLDDSLKTYETDLGTVHYDPKSLYMMFESKSGYLWSTAVYDSAANINTEWRNKAKSIVTLNYYDKNGNKLGDLTANADTVFVVNNVVQRYKHHGLQNRNGSLYFQEYNRPLHALYSHYLLKKDIFRALQRPVFRSSRQN